MPPKPPTDIYNQLSESWLWRGLNRNGDELGRTMLCIRICHQKTALDKLTDEMNELLCERKKLSRELWRRTHA